MEEDEDGGEVGEVTWGSRETSARHTPSTSTVSASVAIMLTQKSENVHRCRVHDFGAVCGTEGRVTVCGALVDICLSCAVFVEADLSLATGVRVRA